MKVWPNHSRGAWQLYGHSHGNLPDDPISLSMDVGVDSHDFVPLHFDEIQAVLKVKAEAKAAHIAKRSAALKSADSPESRELLDRARAFERYIGIDYSGAEKPIASLKGLRVYMAHRDTPPVEVQPPACAKKYWTRRGIAEWLAKVLSQDIPTLGIDHGFSFPLRYFTEHGLTFDWRAFLDDFQRHWPTDDDHTYVDFVRDGVCGNEPARSGDPRWRRVTEIRGRGAKSVFHFDVQGQVAKSTHSGIPWLRYIDLKARSRSLLAVLRVGFSSREIRCGRSIPGALEPEFPQGES